MTFRDSCREVAQRFIQTVVVVDDQAFAPPPGEGAPAAMVVAPSLRGFDPNSTSAQLCAEKEPTAEDRPSTVSAHWLDTRNLSRRFADMGIACSVYAPEPDEVCGNTDDGAESAKNDQKR